LFHGDAQRVCRTIAWRRLDRQEGSKCNATLHQSDCVVATVALVCAPSMARATGGWNPWAGVNFGNDFSNTHGGFGVNAGGMGAG
jgi:hypothetical protein